jgi:hypothetical protein
MLKYKCLICGIEWGDSGATESDISHGYCPLCIRTRFTERINQSLLRAGHSDCFNSGYNDCAEKSCCFRTACQEDSIAGWRKALLEYFEGPDIELSGP